MSDGDQFCREVRKRAWHYLNPDVAAKAGMTLAQLQQFAAGGYHPDAKTVDTLAAVMRLHER